MQMFLSEAPWSICGDGKKTMVLTLEPKCSDINIEVMEIIPESPPPTPTQYNDNWVDSDQEALCPMSPQENEVRIKYCQ